MKRVEPKRHQVRVRAKQFVYKPRPQERDLIGMMRPRDISDLAEKEPGALKYFVFHEGDLVILSLVTRKGTVNLPFSGTGAQELAHHLDQAAQQVAQSRS